MVTKTARRPSVAELERATPNGHAKDDGRDKKSGQFLPGNTFSRGVCNWAKQVGIRRAALAEAFTVEEVVALGRKLYEQAMAGDTFAAKVLMPYLVGKPTPPVDPDLLALEKLRAAPDVVEVAMLGTKVDVAYAVEDIEARQAKDREGHAKLLEAELEYRQDVMDGFQP
jgi:hypothetical protein